MCIVFYFNDTATTEIDTYLHPLSLHNALPISSHMRRTILSILLLSILMAPVSCSMAPSRSEDVNQETTARLYHVREVIDGDTFYLEDGEKEIGRESCRERVCQYV